ncbi:MAG: AAA family ATPase [Planctomycetota bacterium]
MEALKAAATAFLEDDEALEQARDLDEARTRALPELLDALLAFRDADESLARLVERIEYHLTLTHEPADGGPARNLWGFRNEDESRFATRFLQTAPRIPEVDLASLFRSHLADGTTDAERVQILLAFGEFVAGLDARGDGAEPLGIGPATHFLTFAWHVLSKGEEPVFQFSSDHAIRRLARSGALGPEARDRDWEPRFTTFFRVSRAVVDAIPKLPKRMRAGWAVEHVLDYVNAHADRWADLASTGSSGDDFGGSGVWQPKKGGGQPSIERPASATIERPGASATIERPRQDPPSDPRPVERPRPPTDPRPVERPSPPTDPRSKKKASDRFQQIARAKKNKASDPPTDPRPARAPEPPSDGRGKRKRDLRLPKKQGVRIVDTTPLGGTGMSLEDALPPDRTPPGGTIRPPREEVQRWETERDDPEFKTAAMAQREARERREAEERERRESARQARAEEAEARKRAEEAEAAREAQESEARRQAEEAARRQAAAAEESVRRAVTNFDPTEDDLEPLPFERERREAGAPSESSRLATAAMLSELRGEVVRANQGPPPPSENEDRLARDLNLLPALCEDMLAAVRERGRLLLVGPPCTGKTYVARRLAIHVAGHTDRVLFLRGHPGLSYAALIDERGTPGLVRAFCERARGNRELEFVLLIDELDRGDSAAAFGELIGALSERGNPVRLTSGEDLVVPRNLHVLATARDYPYDPGLMARFPITPLEADSAVLRRFLGECRPGLEWVARMLDVLNVKLGERGHPLRIGHGFFMDPSLDVVRVRRVWQREVLPLLASHGIDTAELGYDALRPRD